MREALNSVELFAGAGGGILAGLMLGHRPVCAVEIDPFCRSVLVRRQNEGRLPPFPVWDDVRTFEGRRWRGVVDIVSGGFPCQNISCAGNGAGLAGTHSSLWFEMLRIVREVRPAFVFVENSNQLVRRGLDVILGGLAESGYDAEWLVLGADDVGAPHIRKRCWILGRNTDNKESPTVAEIQAKNADAGRIGTLADTDGPGREKQRRTFASKTQHATFEYVRKELADTGDCWIEQWLWQLPGTNQNEGAGLNHTGRMPVNAFRQWWELEPGLGRVVDGVVPHRVDRLRAIGNGQVLLCTTIVKNPVKNSGCFRRELS